MSWTSVPGEISKWMIKEVVGKHLESKALIRKGQPAFIKSRSCQTTQPDSKENGNALRVTGSDVGSLLSHPVLVVKTEGEASIQ